MFRNLMCVASVCACCVLVTTPAVAQDKLHTGRITKSFTEPVEKSVAASAEVGIIAVAHVTEGDRVHVGDPLAEINQAVLKESLAIAQARSESTARLDAAKSQLDLTQSQLVALQELVNGGHTNKFEVEQKTSEYQTALAEFRSAQDEIKLAKLEVQRIKAQSRTALLKARSMDSLLKFTNNRVRMFLTPNLNTRPL